jgi:hypothetical protein
MTGRPLHTGGVAASIRELLADLTPGNQLEEGSERRE